MADETAVVDPNTLSHKDQHRLRAQMVREGNRSLAFHTITDYKNATPTFPKSKAKRKSRAKVKPSMSDIDKAIMDGYEELFQEFDGIPAIGEPREYTPKEALIARLNAGLRG